MTTFICKECGKEYQPLTLIQKKFCSAKCRARWWSRKTREKYRELHKITTHKVCPVCGTEFNAARPNVKFCSKECKRYSHQLRHILSLHSDRLNYVIKYTVQELNKNA